ncbi:MAG: hypothetical protein ACJ8AH_07355, partial [Stellaceae bacterium]
MSEAFGAVFAAALSLRRLINRRFGFSFPVDLHAGTGGTARRRRSKRRFLADEVLIDSGLGA